MTKDTGFTQDQYEKLYPQNIELHYWHQARNKIILKEVNPKLTYLEVGCGTGNIVRFLRGKSIDCFGVEVSNFKFNLDIRQYCFSSVSAENLPLEFRTNIQGILLLDVLEHIENPKKFIANLLTQFPSIQHLLITVPARPELWSNFDVFNGHFIRYRPQTLLETLDLNDWAHYKIHYAFKLFYIPMLIACKFNIKRKLSVSTPKHKFSKIIHKALGIVFYYESFILNKIPGSSLVLSLNKNLIN
jgi:SAM-dependent methyltransferase